MPVPSATSAAPASNTSTEEKEYELQGTCTCAVRATGLTELTSVLTDHRLLRGRMQRS